MKNNGDIRAILRKMKKMNRSFFINTMLIVGVSLFSVFSATHQRTYGFFYRELVWIGIGLGVYLFFSFFDYRNYAKYSKVIYLFNVILLLCVFVFGETRLGAQRWIPLGPLNIQPSEFSKLFIVLTLSELLANKYKNNFRGMKHIVLSGLHIVPIFLLIAKQPDLGTSLVLIFLYCILIFIHGIDWKSIFVIVGAGVAFVPVSYFFLLKEYQKQRILTFLNPEADMLGSGWNVIQSMIAVGSGGVFGKGFFQGTQSKLRFLPESHTDFIGAVFLEETGLIGGLILLGLYLALIIQIARVGSSVNDNYGRLVCYGVAAIIFFHTVVNMGMIMGVMPVTGLPLLLMSYGGSSFIFTFMMLGIVQSVRIYKD